MPNAKDWVSIASYIVNYGNETKSPKPLRNRVQGGKTPHSLSSEVSKSLTESFIYLFVLLVSSTVQTGSRVASATELLFLFEITT